MRPGALADLAGGPVTLVCSLRSAPPTDAETLRREADALLAGFTDQALHAGYAGEDVEQAVYALVALIDERVLALPGTVGERWLSDPLQMRHFGSFAAGDEFYVRLARYRQPGQAARADVLEVFHLCLALGFLGRHADGQAAGQRHQLMGQVANEILAVRGCDRNSLSPSWRPTGTPPPRPGPWRLFGLPAWMVPVVMVSSVVIAWAAGDLIVHLSVERVVAHLQAPR